MVTGKDGRDSVFKEEITQVSDFKFGTNVVNVFDDMVSRSVPFYDETQRMLAEIAADHVKDGLFMIWGVPPALH
jgi:tRNA (cmo5U34)-methyltransferase